MLDLLSYLNTSWISYNVIIAIKLSLYTHKRVITLGLGTAGFDEFYIKTTNLLSIILE